jgi:hypothetical protein
MNRQLDALSGLDDADAKIEWAKGQRDRLGELTQAYLQTQPWKMWKELDEVQGGAVMMIKLTEPPPRVVTAHMGMMLQACRSALDYAAITLAKSDQVKKLRDVYFPIATDKPAFELASAKKLKGMSEASTDLVERFQPYVTGRQWLRLLNGLNRDDKHNRLLRATAVSAGIGLTNGFGAIKIGGSVDTYGPIDEPRPLLWCGEGAQWEFHVKITLGLTEPDTEQAKSLADTFDVIAEDVCQVIQATRMHLA